MSFVPFTLSANQSVVKALEHPGSLPDGVHRDGKDFAPRTESSARRTCLQTLTEDFENIGDNAANKTRPRIKSGSSGSIPLERRSVQVGARSGNDEPMRMREGRASCATKHPI